MPTLRHLKNLSEMQGFAASLSNVLCSGGKTLALKGELGAGKTTLVSYLAKALGCEQAVSSPSFVLEHEYGLKGNLFMQHWDLYRVDLIPSELLEPPASNVIRVIEWCDKFDELWQRSDMRLTLSFAEHPESREIVEE